MPAFSREEGEIIKKGAEHLRGVGDNSGGISGERLRSFVQRIERLESDKAAVAQDIKSVYEESKGVGFDNKIIRQVIKLRKTELEKRRENEELLSLYMSSLGME
jgi:uncharacterized protein (UPF0335 family)